MIREAAGRFHALDDHRNLAKGGRFTYSRETAARSGQWVVAAKEDINLLPLPRLAIRDIRPNPFNPRTSVVFYLADPQRVKPGVQDVAGRGLKLLADDRLPAGPQTVHWDGCDAAGRTMASGVHTVLLESELGIDRRKIMLVH